MAQRKPAKAKQDQSETTAKIIAAAEKRMCAGGYHGFSFREIAADVGIKSASVHHHFPTKEDLAVAVVRSYTDREMERLGDPNDPSRQPDQLLASYIAIFRDALADKNRMCLCGLLASESASLPTGVTKEVQRFFASNLAWTEAIVRRADPALNPATVKSKALALTASLEGALLGSHCQGNVAMFDTVAKEIKASLLPTSS